MICVDQNGQAVEISVADQMWLDDAYFKEKQLRLGTDAPRAALAYRVSTKGQVDHDDIPMQKIDCRKFAQKQGWRVVKEVAEKGVSGSKVSASKRDAIQQLKEEAANGEFDILLVYMFDRLGRIESETPFVLEWFVQHGIEMWSTHEGQQKIETHGDKLMNYIRFWQAAGESEKTSIRTRDRIRQIVSSGHYTGGFVCYGYQLVDQGRRNKRDKPVMDLVINEEEATWVRELFYKVIQEGTSGYALAEMLNNRGLRTRAGAKFQSSNIIRIIRHEGYTGYIITKNARSEYIKELQIIDRETFDKANDIINRRKAKSEQERKIAHTSQNPTLLAGIVYCAHCGAKMSGFMHTDRYKLADGSIREKVQPSLAQPNGWWTMCGEIFTARDRKTASRKIWCDRRCTNRHRPHDLPRMPINKKGETSWKKWWKSARRFPTCLAAMRFPQKMPVIRRKKMLLAVKVTVFPPPR